MIPRAILICATVILAGCGSAPLDDTTSPGSTTNAMVNQARAADIFPSTTLPGYSGHDTVQLRITNDRLSLQGGGGTIPVVTGLKLTATTPVGTFTGTRSISGSTETYTVTVDGAGLVTDLRVDKTGTGAGSFTAAGEAAPTVTSGSDGVWTVGVKTDLEDDTLNNATRMTIDQNGLLWWDLDGNPATTDDVVMIALKASGSYLTGAATILYDWKGDATADDAVVLSVQVAIAGGAVTHILAHAAPTVVFPGRPAADWVDAAPVLTAADVPSFGPWSAAMAGHWLAMPTSGGKTISGSVMVTRVEREFSNVGGLLSIAINQTGAETETVVTSYALAEKSGYPVVKVSTDTTVSRLGGGTEHTLYAVYYARHANGAIYRIGFWEDSDDNGVFATAEETLYGAGTEVLAFPADEPASNTTYLPFVRWGMSTTSTHLRDQPFHGVNGHAALVGQMSSASVATTIPAPNTFTTVIGTATNARLTSYWLPGTGVTGMTWAADSQVVRRFTRSNGTYRLIERAVIAVSDLVKL